MCQTYRKSGFENWVDIACVISAHQTYSNLKAEVDLSVLRSMSKYNGYYDSLTSGASPTNGRKWRHRQPNAISRFTNLNNNERRIIALSIAISTMWVVLS